MSLIFPFHHVASTDTKSLSIRNFKEAKMEQYQRNPAKDLGTERSGREHAPWLFSEDVLGV